jgi:hypothetical protein
MKQNPVMKKQQSAFGKAASIAHALCNKVAEELNFRIPLKSRNEMVSLTYKWLADEKVFPTLYLPWRKVELNDRVTLDKILCLQMKPVLCADHTVMVSIGQFNPRFQITAPLWTSEVELNFLLVTLTTEKDNKEVQKYPVRITVPYTDEEVVAQNLSFPVKPANDVIVLVSLAVCFKGKDLAGKDKDPKWLPAGILGIGRIPDI